MHWQMLAVLYALFLALCIDLSELCSCRWSHPQEKFCNSDFVILARIKQYKISNGTKIYKVRIRKQFKISEKAEVALKSGQLLTPDGSSLCESELSPGKMYVLSGRVVHLKARIDLCGMADRWEYLSKRQKKGLRMMYRHGCVCKISTFMNSRNSCLWPKEKMACYETEGICLPSPSKVCRWAKSAALNNCLHAHDKRLTISRWSG
ncbi:hypothetical protein AMK59_4348 [Oryctes borbonicus]|uniref:NTR domain-containing protein n=1 Tax=Oryctes borbonicus TaxID=1629725 RepID=A0A0T6B6Z4_9SCAR|nr:hypothetical protein AMK59_4348 [Oryctes borbonicus]